jgi:RNA recognition motif-containing protein
VLVVVPLSGIAQSYPPDAGLEFEMKKIYVGNLSWDTTETELRHLFESSGPVATAAVVMDRDTGRSRGFGFVEMEDGDAERAIQKFNGREVGGRNLNVSEARAKDDRAPRPNGGRYERSNRSW